MDSFLTCCRDSRFSTGRRLFAALLASVALSAFSATPADAQAICNSGPCTLPADTTISGTGTIVHAQGTGILTIGDNLHATSTALFDTDGVVIAESGGIIDLGSGAVLVGTQGIANREKNGIKARYGGTITGNNVSITLTSDWGRGISAYYANSNIIFTGATNVTMYTSQGLSNFYAVGAEGTNNHITLDDATITIQPVSGSVTNDEWGMLATGNNATITANGTVQLNLSGNRVHGVTVQGATSAVTLNNVGGTVSAPAGQAYGYETGGTLTVTGTSNLRVTGETGARGLSVSTGGTAVFSGPAEFDVTGTTMSAQGMFVEGDARVTLSGGSTWNVTAVTTAMGMFLVLNGSNTLQPYVSLTNTTMTVTGGTNAYAIRANEPTGAAYTMKVEATGSTFNSSGTGIELLVGDLDVFLTDSTMNNGRGVAFILSNMGGASTHMNVTADHSRFNGLSSTPASNSIFNLTMNNGSEWTDASGNLTNLTLNNSAVRFIAPSGGMFTTLTVENDFIGVNGHVYLHAELNDDTSSSDLLHVRGNTSGTTTLHVTNAGGPGALTTGDGIMVVQVDGNSGGAFSLAGDYVTPGGNQAVVAGAYAYTLQKDGLSAANGNWYLRSEDCPVYGCATLPTPPGGGGGGGGEPILYQPFVPVAEAYASNMARVVVDMESFRHRMGGHYDVLSSSRPFGGFPATTGSISSTQSPDFAGVPGLSGVPIMLPVKSDGTPMYMWADIRGSHTSLRPSHSTTGVSSSANDWEIRSGFDGMLWERNGSHLMGGVNVFYGGSTTRTKSVYGSGDLDMRRYGLGATLTWYNDDGTYVDLQGKAMWFESDLQADALGSLAYHAKAFGWAASIEVGHEFNITPNFTLTPQAQLTYGTINFRSFKDRFGNTYELDDTASLRGRLGIEAAYTWTSTSDAGEMSETRLYGIANLYHEFRDEKKVRVSGVSIESTRERNRGGLGLGVSHTWKSGKYRIFGEVEATRSLHHHGSQAVTGRIGFVMRF
ncbi:MAG: autotransporter outer membrane beta-barrel domain-containing protein [Methylobacteriaceae bacterium]|jgi:fibronectin-binding autotransporter adhesin|nr:autotransporter outer membrane beta-barrel domain-containing protein [Methylobacteriaceae bacterium]